MELQDLKNLKRKLTVEEAMYTGILEAIDATIVMLYDKLIKKNN